MREPTRLLIDSLHRRLLQTRLKITFTMAAAGFFLALGIGVSLWVLGTLIESRAWFSPVYRSLLLAGIVGPALFVLARRTLLPLLNHFGILGEFSEISLAREIGNTFPQIRDRFVNLLQLESGQHSDASPELLDAAAGSLGEQIAVVNFEEIVSVRRTVRTARLAAIPLSILLVLLVAGPGSLTDASLRLLSPMSEYEPPAPFSVLVLPGDATIVRGNSISISAVTAGDSTPDQLNIEYLFQGDNRSQMSAMEKETPSDYTWTFEDVRLSFEYRSVWKSVSSPWYRIAVIERPVVQRIQLNLKFPTYTRLPDRLLPPNVGDVTALRGTRIGLSVTIEGAAADSGAVVFGDGTIYSMVGDGSAMESSFTVRKGDFYHLFVRSADGVVNAAPIEYAVEALADEAPAISIVLPPPVSDLNESAEALIRYRISDDFGFTGVKLFYRRAESTFGEVQESFSDIRMPLADKFLLDQESDFTWSLLDDSDLDPVPGDVIKYYLVVRDNDTFSGPKESRTEVYTLRFPSLAEQYESLNTAEDDATEMLESLLDRAQEVRDEFETLKEGLREKPEPDWKDKRRLDQLKDRQSQLEESVETLAEQVENLTDKIEQNDLVSPETLELFEELKEVISDVNSPELMEALDNLQQSLEQMNLGEMNRALDDFEFNDKMYQERLQRTLDIFKQVQIQKDLDEAARRAENLEKSEKNLKEKTAELEAELMEKSSESNQRQPASGEKKLSREQKSAAEDMKELEEKLEQIRERMEDVKRAPVSEMQNLSEDTQDLEIPKQMSENAEQIENQEFGKAQQGQQQIQQQLNQLKSQLSQIQQNMQGQQLQINTAGLRRILEDVLTLSENQESLRIRTSKLSSESPGLRDIAQSEVSLSEGVSTVADSLRSLSRDVPQMGRDVQKYAGETLKSMSAATSSLVDRNVRRTVGQQKAAMTNLNELAVILSELLNQMMNGQGSGSGNMSMQQLMEQLQNLGQQQQDLNQQIQKLLNDAQGNRLTRDMAERLRQLGGQQEQIRRQIKQLGRNRNTRDRLMGDLNRIAEQMLESIQDLQENRVSRRTLQRQQQILTRMLEATKSLQERGKDRKRKSESGDDLLRIGPGQLSPTEQLDRLRRDLFKALESGYNPDFEKLIRRYFDLLQKQSTNESGN